MSEPYIIKAGEFDPGTQERQTFQALINHWETRDTHDWVPDDKPIVVRDKSLTLEEVLTKHGVYNWAEKCCKGCGKKIDAISLDEVIIGHMADELRKAGFDRV